MFFIKKVICWHKILSPLSRALPWPSYLRACKGHSSVPPLGIPSDRTWPLSVLEREDEITRALDPFLDQMKTQANP